MSPITTILATTKEYNPKCLQVGEAKSKDPIINWVGGQALASGLLGYESGDEIHLARACL